MSPSESLSESPSESPSESSVRVTVAGPSDAALASAQTSFSATLFKAYYSPSPPLS